MGQTKFLRNYILTVKAVGEDPLLITPPFTLELDITHNVLTSSNNGSFRIYNLNENTRNQLRFNLLDTPVYMQITLAVGYGSPPYPVVFKGNITQAWSYREGTNFITNIEAFDGGFAIANGTVDALSPLPSGTLNKTVLTTMLSTLPNVSLGAVGNIPGSLPSRGNTFTGNTMDNVRDLLGNLDSRALDGANGFTAFIHFEKVYVLNTYEYVQQASVLKINSSSGLLGTPIRERTILNFNILFEPSIYLGQQILLESETDKNFNGTYKVNSVKHRGTVSEAVCGDLITSVGLFYPLAGTVLIPVVPV